MKHRLAVMVTLLLLATLSSVSRADAPRLLNFQGILGAADGSPMPDGDYTVTFRLYDALADGNLLWTEPDKVVSVTGGQGRFSTLLGGPTPFDGLAFDVPYFLEVEISGEGAPMTPRVPLSSAPYALNTGGAATLSLPFDGTISTDASIGIQVENTGSGGIGFRSITHSGRSFWGTTDGSYAVYGEALTTGTGVQGIAVSGAGVAGYTTTGVGVLAQSSGTGQGVRAISANRAVWATSTGASYGVFAESNTGIGVNGLSNTGIGVAGSSGPSQGVFGSSNTGEGVRGQSNTGSGVVGVSNAWVGAYGQSTSSIGMWGKSDGNSGVVGESNQWIGVYGVSTQFEGVRGESFNNNHGALVGVHRGSGIAIYGVSEGGGHAGWFDGRVRVQVLEIAGGADLAENFETTEKAEPGTVMAIDTAKPGSLRVSQGAYNRKVAGVVSGAGNLSAGVVLSDPSGPKDGLPIAMSGRIWTLCDASNGPIEAGDLLTTSDTPGRAMKVTDHARATGATIGKAMTELASGEGLVLVLVSLQ